MISIGREKVVSISEAKHENKDDVHIFFYGLDTLRNPVIAIKGKPETMGDLKEILETMLGVKVEFTAN